MDEAPPTANGLKITGTEPTHAEPAPLVADSEQQPAAATENGEGVHAEKAEKAEKADPAPPKEPQEPEIWQKRLW